MSHFTGTLKVYLFEAENLSATACAYSNEASPPPTSNEKLCPFVVVFADADEVGRSSVKKLTNHPNWCPAKLNSETPTTPKTDDTNGTDAVTTEKTDSEAKTDDASPAAETSQGCLITLKKLVTKETLNLCLCNKGMLKDQFIADVTLTLKEIKSAEDVTLELDPCGKLKVRFEIEGEFSDPPVSSVTETGVAETQSEEKTDETETEKPNEGDAAKETTTVKHTKKANSESKRLKSHIHRIHTILEHKFQATAVTQATVCAQCHGVIHGLGRQGYQCQLCAYMVHKHCHTAVKTACAMGKTGRANALAPSDSGASVEGEAAPTSDAEVPEGKHQLSTQNYLTPTFCRHCGFMLFGFAAQGMRCARCRNNFHRHCQLRLMSDCSPAPASEPAKPVKAKKPKEKKEKSSADKKSPKAASAKTKKGTTDAAVEEAAGDATAAPATEEANAASATEEANAEPAAAEAEPTAETEPAAEAEAEPAAEE